MASEEPVNKTAELYRVNSLVRATATRTQRAKAAKHHRFVQRFGGGAITVRRARPATVTRQQLEQHRAELLAAVEDGRVQVTTLTGGVVDLKTLLAAPAPVVTKPAPHPPLDSAARDKTFPGGVGTKMPMFPDHPSQDDNPEPPSSSLDEEVRPVALGGDPAEVRRSRRLRDEGSE